MSAFFDPVTVRVAPWIFAWTFVFPYASASRTPAVMTSMIANAATWTITMGWASQTRRGQASTVDRRRMERTSPGPPDLRMRRV